MSIINHVQGNVLASGLRHIAFGVSTEERNRQGFAGIVARRYWSQLTRRGPRQLSEVFTHRAKDYNFYAMVCYSASPDGFAQTPQVITQCLNAIDVPDTETIACVMIGNGYLGSKFGADSGAILRGINGSRKRIVVYSPSQT